MTEDLLGGEVEICFRAVLLIRAIFALALALALANLPSKERGAVENFRTGDGFLMADTRMTELLFIVMVSIVVMMAGRGRLVGV